MRLVLGFLAILLFISVAGLFMTISGTLSDHMVCGDDSKPDYRSQCPEPAKGYVACRSKVIGDDNFVTEYKCKSIKKKNTTDRVLSQSENSTKIFLW